jgi:hypothetical protein
VRKRKKIELSPEWRARSEQTQRVLRERLEFHARRRAEREAEARGDRPG